ncbi:MAG: MATE family efflux transporter [Clostridia bacterium]|nr:MATE family efflux transporter [Clostridia bacterium]
MTNDFTKGSPMKQIFFFTIPYLIGNLFQQFYNIVDTVIVGRVMNADALAAVGSTGGLVWFANGAIVSLTTGFSAVISQYFGAKRPEKVRHAFGMSIFLSAVTAILVTTVTCIFAMPVLELLKTPHEHGIINMAYDYVMWIFIGLGGSALFNLLSNAIRALGDSKTPLVFLISACIINIILDIFLVPRMGTAGAGLATAIAQLTSGLMCIVFIVKKQPVLHIKRRHLKLNGVLIMHLLRVGIPMSLLNMLLSIGSIVMQFVSNTLGNVYMASQTAAAKIEQFVTQPLLSLGSATTVFVAQNFGAKKYSRIVDGCRKAQLMGIIWCIGISLIMFAFGKFFLGLVVGFDETEIIKNGYTYIVINTAACIIVSMLIIAKGALQAMGRAVSPIISGPTEILGRAMSSIGALMLFSSASAQYLGICFSNPLAWLFGLIPIGIDYLIVMKRFKRLAQTEQE